MFPILHLHISFQVMLVLSSLRIVQNLSFCKEFSYITLLENKPCQHQPNFEVIKVTNLTKWFDKRQFLKILLSYKENKMFVKHECPHDGLIIIFFKHDLDI